MITDRDEILKCIDADEVILGENVSLGEGVKMAGIGGRAEKIVIGDDCWIGNNVLVLAPRFEVGDYSTIHQNCRLSGYKPLTIGHNFWTDQNCIFNCTDRFRVGNGVGVGAYSQLWTHIRHGDTLIGCKFDMDQPMTIHDDVWFVGHCMVSPIEAGEGSMAMLGSVVTRNMEAYHVYGGAPAKDLTDKIGSPYNDVSVDERVAELNRRLEAFIEKNPEYDRDQLVVVDSWESEPAEGVTAFNVADRTYSKIRTDIERAAMRDLLPKAKFIPR